MITDAGLEIKSRSSAAFLEKTSQLKTHEIKKYQIYKTFCDNKWYSKSAESEIKSSYEILFGKGLSEIREQIITHHTRNHSLSLTTNAILETIYLLAIVNQIKTFVDEYKKEFNVIPIYEFYIRFNKIVRNFSIPFIYSILGEKYNHYLIDEFQDTSRLQWENLFPLIENSMGSNYLNMVVGDGKQSIYRWRGGDVEIMENDLKDKFNQEQINIKPLDSNHRSKKSIVDFNNSFFKKITEARRGKNPLLAKIYNDISQIPVSEEGGFVSMEFLNLEKLLIANIRAPRPIAKINNVLVMEYIGDFDKPAPLMKDVKLKNPEKIFLTLIDFISKMYKKVDLVHSDMSPFNVLIYKDQPYIIDLGQGVLTEHHNAHDFLKRDIHNIVKFFKKYDIESDEKKIYNDITKK